MTIGTLKKTIVAYCQKTATTDFVVGGVDLLLNGLNAARRQAEMAHEFEVAKVVVDLVVDDVAGAALSTATLHGTATAVDVNSIISGGIADAQGNVCQVDVKTIESFNREKARYGRNEYDDELRIPSDAEFANGYFGKRNRQILRFGNQVYKYPYGTEGQSSTLVLNVVKWFPDYTADSDEDFFCKKAWEYLKWATIVDLNYQIKEFVPRQEGNLPPPTALASAALQNLIEWDEYNAGRNS